MFCLWEIMTSRFRIDLVFFFIKDLNKHNLHKLKGESF